MVPIAGVILAIVMTLELIQMITDKNNLHDEMCIRDSIRPVLHVSSVNDELLSAVGKLAAEYGRIGGNLNQIARYLNEYLSLIHISFSSVRHTLRPLV